MKKFLLFMLLFVNLHIVMTVSAQKIDKTVELKEVVIEPTHCTKCGVALNGTPLSKHKCRINNTWGVFVGSGGNTFSLETNTSNTLLDAFEDICTNGSSATATQLDKVKFGIDKRTSTVALYNINFNGNQYVVVWGAGKIVIQKAFTAISWAFTIAEVGPTLRPILDRWIAGRTPTRNEINYIAGLIGEQLTAYAVTYACSCAASYLGTLIGGPAGTATGFGVGIVSSTIATSYLSPYGNKLFEEISNVILDALEYDTPRVRTITTSTEPKDVSRYTGNGLPKDVNRSIIIYR